jgi:hypothetical protein
MGIEKVLTAPRSPWQNPYAERIIGSIRRDCLDHVIIRPDPRSIQPPSQLTRSSHFPRSVDSIIGTNVARPEPQRSSMARSLRRDPSLSTYCVGQPISGSPVKIAALDFDDHGDPIPRTERFPSIACRGPGSALCDRIGFWAKTAGYMAKGAFLLRSHFGSWSFWSW